VADAKQSIEDSDQRSSSRTSIKFVLTIVPFACFPGNYFEISAYF
jgi:hypothetical protein